MLYCRWLHVSLSGDPWTATAGGLTDRIQTRTVHYGQTEANCLGSSECHTVMLRKGSTWQYDEPALIPYCCQ
jgi:hypothetical protein